MLHLQQGLMPGYQAQPPNHFTKPDGHLGSLNRFQLGVLSPTITRNYNSCFTTNSGGTELTLPPQSTTNGGLFGDSDSSCGIEFSTGYHLEDDSDISSPPLWKTSPLTTPTTIPSPLHLLRREAMEMVRSVPESTHELSLKDMAGLPAPVWMNRRSKSEANDQEENKKKMKRRRNERRASRNRSMDSRDFLLKMFLPTALGQKKRSFGNCTRSKLLPKPDQEMEKSVEAEWWKKRFSSSRESVNNRTSSSRSSSHDSTRRYLFLLFNFPSSKLIIKGLLRETHDLILSQSS